MIILLSHFFVRSCTLHPPTLPSLRKPHPPSHRHPPSLHSHHPLPLPATTATPTAADTNATLTLLHFCHNQLPQSTITSTASAYHPPTTATNHSPSSTTNCHRPPSPLSCHYHNCHCHCLCLPPTNLCYQLHTTSYH